MGVMRKPAPAIVAVILSLSLAAPVRAGELSLMLTNLQGRPAPDAVAMVRPDGFVAHGPVRFPWAYRMAQKDRQFLPYVLIVPVGTEVAFPNQDPFKHHVYSFSLAKPFELKLYSRDETRTVRFDKAGVVSLGCNIHDDMTAFIRVVDTPFAIKSDGRGEADIRELPAGPATLTIWHPLMKSRGGEMTRPITIPASGALTLAIALDLRAAPLRRGGY